MANPKKKPVAAAGPSTDVQDDAANAKPKKRVREVKAVTPAEAVKQNPKGVKVIPTGLIDSQAHIAGYLGLSDTQQLRDYVNAYDSEPDSALSLWLRYRKTGFGVAEHTEKTTYKSENIFQMINDPKSISKACLEAGLPLRYCKYEKTDHKRALACFVVTLYQIIKDNPDRFPTVGDNPEYDVQFVGGKPPEEYYRAYVFLRWFYRASTRKVKSKQDGGRAQNIQAIQPTYLTDDDFRGVTSQEGAELSAGNSLLTGFLANDAADSGDEEISDEEYASDKEGPNGNIIYSAPSMFLNLLTESFRDVPAKVSETSPDGNPLLTSLSPEAQTQLLQNISAQAKVLYPPVNPAGDEKNDTIGADQASGSLITTSDTVIARAVHVSEVEATLEAAGEELDPDCQAAFWELQNSTNQATAQSFDYLSSCSVLGVDPVTPSIGSGITLKAWQVTGAVWAQYMLNSPIRSAILGDDVGLGKSITSLSVIQNIFRCDTEVLTSGTSPTGWQLGAELSAGNLTAPGPYKPTLILFPALAASVWRDELCLFPDLKPYCYYSAPDKATITTRASILPRSVDDLKKTIEALDKKDPSTSCHVFMSTYSTWYKRTLDGVAMPRRSKSTRKRSRVLTDEEEEEDEPADDDEMDEDELRKLKSRIPDYFGLVICDEAHKLKSPRTRTHRSVHLMRPQKLLLVSATICGNQAADIRGIISLMHGVSNHYKPLDTNFSDLSEYSMMQQKISKLPAGNLHHLDLMECRASLDPKRFRGLSGSNMDIDLCAALIRPILMLSQIRRYKGLTVELEPGKSVTVGADIPAYRVLTVELQMSRSQAEVYAEAHKTLANNMGTGADAVTGEGHINMGRHRWLSHASFNASLDRFRSRAPTGVKHVDGWHEKGVHGSVFYHRLTRGEDVDVCYRDRVTFATWMCKRSVKLQWLAGFLLHTCINADKKVLIFTEWPVIQWNIELFLLMVGIEFVSIRSAHTQSHRDQVIADFNDPLHQVKVCVTSYRCSSTSTNLQKACHNIVMAEVPGSGSTANQSIGRVWRIGQAHQINAYILTTDHTYDQVIQSRAAKKYYMQLAATANLDFKMPADNSAFDHGDSEDEDERLSASRDMIIGYYTKMFGQRSPRDEWNDVHDLTSKDKLPGEGLGLTLEQMLEGRKNKQST
jgi:hypothetical protein